jgi:hypothetical protein
MQQQSPPEQFDLPGMVDDLNALLRLKTTVIGIKMFAAVEDMTAIPKIRRPTAVHTTDQIVSMASRLGWTVGITGDDLVGAQCRAVIGLSPQDDKWLAGENYVGVWHGTAEDARKRQEALDVVPYGRYQAMAVSPLVSGRLNPPDICLVMGAGAQNRRALSVAAVLCRAPLWRRARRRDADGAAAGPSCQGDYRHEAVGQERLALSDRALWDPGRCACRDGRFLRQEIALRNGVETVIASEAKQSMAAREVWIASSLRSSQ